LVPVVAAAAARILLVLATDGVVLGVGLVFFIRPERDHVLEVGDGLGAATTEVFKGAVVVEAVLEEVDDLFLGDVDYGSFGSLCYRSVVVSVCVVPCSVGTSVPSMSP
jgi:hypothetical protein